MADIASATDLVGDSSADGNFSPRIAALKPARLGTEPLEISFQA
jgi:hypothetical protein